jgi:hypothetical protein
MTAMVIGSGLYVLAAALLTWRVAAGFGATARVVNELADVRRPQIDLDEPSYQNPLATTTVDDLRPYKRSHGGLKVAANVVMIVLGVTLVAASAVLFLVGAVFAHQGHHEVFASVVCFVALLVVLFAGIARGLHVKGYLRHAASDRTAASGAVTKRRSAKVWAWGMTLTALSYATVVLFVVGLLRLVVLH